MMNRQLRNNIRDVFDKVQFNKTCHKSMDKKLKDYYHKVLTIGYVLFIQYLWYIPY